MKAFLNKVFGLREGEIYITLLMQLYIFLIITVLLIVKPTTNALFVNQLGANKLPLAYLLVALFAVITTFLYGKAIKKHSLVKITILTLVFYSISFFGLAVIIKFNLLYNQLLYAYYVLVALFAVTATSQFWIFANMVFNAIEAKRIFGFIGAGAIAGGIFGGYLTSIIASFFGNEIVVFTAGILLLACLPILKKIYQLRLKNLTIFKRKQVIAEQDKLENTALQVILKSKHLIYIASITGIGVFVAKLIDYQFSDFADKVFNNADDLAAFFGFWLSTFNVIAIVIQLFFTAKVLSKFGVSTTLLGLPLLIGLSSLVLIVVPELWVLVLIKGIDGSFKQSINKAAFELSIMPIPTHEKNQAKSFIDVAVDSIATGFAGFLLIVLVGNFNLPTIYITVIVLVFIFVWLVLIYKLREAYFNSFKKNIQSSLLLDAKKTSDTTKEITLSSLIGIIQKGEESSILKMFDRLKDFKIRGLQPHVVHLLTHPSHEVKIAAIKFLDAFVNHEVIEKVQLLIHEKDDELVYNALNYILNHTPISQDDFFTKYLDHQNSYIANAALLTLAKQCENNNNLANKYKLKARLEDKISFLQTDKNINEDVLAGLLLAIAYSRFVKYYKLILENLDNPNLTIAVVAANAAGITANEVFIKPLLELLQNRLYRKSVINALKSYGPKVIDRILELQLEDAIKPVTRKHIPKVVGAFQDENAIQILLKILQSKNAASRLEAAKALQKVKKKNINLLINLKIIKKVLIKEAAIYSQLQQIEYSIINQTNTQKYINSNQELESNEIRVEILTAIKQEINKSYRIIFKLLSFFYEKADILITFNGLKSENKEARINSLELLDNLLEGSIKGAVMPIIGHVVNNDAELYLKENKINLFTELECFTALMEVSGSNIKKLAIGYIAVSKNKKLLPALLPLKKFKNKAVRKLASDISTQLQKVKD